MSGCSHGVDDALAVGASRDVVWLTTNLCPLPPHLLSEPQLAILYRFPPVSCLPRRGSQRKKVEQSVKEEDHLPKLV